MQKLKLFVATLGVSLASTVLFGATHVFAATKTWSGGGSDNNMTTAGNWTGGAPSAADDLVFPANITKLAVTNDFTAATSFNSITFSGTATQNSNYTVTGNAMTVAAGITDSMTGSFLTGATLNLPLTISASQTFNAGSSYLIIGGTLALGSNTLTFDTGTGDSSISGVVSGTGGITKASAGTLELSGTNTYDGATMVNAGLVVGRSQQALGSANGATTVASGAGLYMVQASGDVTYSEPLTLNGTGASAFIATLGVGDSFGSGGGGTPATIPTSTFSGAITLGSNITLNTGNRGGKITGAITGNFTFTLLSNATNPFEIASSANGSATSNSSLEQAAKATSYPDNNPSTNISVVRNETATVTGTYGDVTVAAGGTLKGTGTVGVVTSSGTIAPGMSPGCLHTSDLNLFSSSSYQAELGGTTACTEYDQLVVTGAVNLDGTLDVSLYNNFKPSKGQTYTIINNDGTDAVTGTFKNLAEGATFTVSGYVFKITYKGGDGNDVVLSVESVPAAPNTGFTLIKSNPLLSAGVILAAAGGVALIARRGTFARATTRR